MKTGDAVRLRAELPRFGLIVDESPKPEKHRDNRSGFFVVYWSDNVMSRVWETHLEVVSESGT
tara:strand:+ start:3954 stop:4142 length:189 start_codon:yes stop_codon:yes gene_type:complete